MRRLQAGGVVTAISSSFICALFFKYIFPSAAIGFNVEQVTYKNLKFQVWDLGGQTSIKSGWLNNCSPRQFSELLLTLDRPKTRHDPFEYDRYSQTLDYFLGPLDPLGLRFDARIVDAQGKEHKSAERYFWLEDVTVVHASPVSTTIASIQNLIHWLKSICT